ncbi:L-histidine Nalpha-methyltransferase [Limimonas halophila]|uniref:L-histidine Nalpha-methyltransferase n=2 Tax=Limimonas halophila TaxID=1082479 RepID=A0A1G7T0Q4_9PROT|nr:L-histidine Nalpha-methyltransferase [Limimonas halophila]
MEKTQLLIHEAIKKHNHINFVPCDIDPNIIQTGISKLNYFYGNELSIYPVQGLFEECISWSPKIDGSTLFTFMGLTYGNMTHEERDSFLRFLRTSMNGDDYFLLSVDLVKDRATMENAYQDTNGLVAKSMLESLKFLNAFYDADFLLDQFYHLAQYEPDRRCIVEYLVSRCHQSVEIPKLGLSIEIQEQERIEAEFSEKFLFEDLISDLSRWGFCPAQTYTDVDMQYAMILLHRGRQVDANALRSAA